MSAPRVSVIVPVHNSEKYLTRCLDSILAQTERNIEVICIDDGSTDSSPEILSSYANRDDRIRLLTQSCRGAGAARNAGLDIAQGTYLSFLDSDDFFEVGMLEAAAHKLDETGADLVVFGSWVYDDTHGQDRPAGWRLNVDNLPANDPFSFRDMPDQIFNSFGNVVWNKLFRSTFVSMHQLRFQEISRCNDTYFSTASLVLASNITYVDRLFVHYRTGMHTNLQSTNDRDPRTMLSPYEGLYHLLVSQGIYDTVQVSFVNWVLDCVTNIVDSFRTASGFLDCRQAILTQLEPTYKLLDMSPEAFRAPKNYDQYRALCTMDPLDYLLQRITSLRGDLALLSQISDQQYQDAIRFEKAVSETKNSVSYRLGHALLIPARLIRNALRCLSSRAS